MFHEKETLIENCLFGVDINPNSVNICRLRLWIEILKNSYYTSESNYSELETLPNIDINIKQGNSLISRFDVKQDIFTHADKQTLDIYKLNVALYKKEQDKNKRRELKDSIEKTKGRFRGIAVDPLKKEREKIDKLTEKLHKLNTDNLFDGNRSRKEQEKIEKKRNELVEKINKLTEQKSKKAEEYRKIYSNSFEWRFEFPEVLDENGNFVGFDVLIGNPPYIKEYENRQAFNGLRNKECYQGKMDIWYLFADSGLKLLKSDYYLCFIATNNWVTNAGASNFRDIVIRTSKIENLTDFGAYMVFEHASIQTMIMFFKNNSQEDNYSFDYRCLQGEKLIHKNVLNLLMGIETENSVLLSPTINKEILNGKPLTFNTDENIELLNKLEAKHNFFIRKKANKKLKIKSELGQGIVAPQDFVNKASAETLDYKVKIGAGIFVLSQDEFERHKFSKKEKEIIKPYFTTDQLQKYCGVNENKYWIIYTKSNINKKDKKTKKIPLDNYPKIKKHLDKFKSVITSDFKPYGLHRAREQYFFESEKIMVLRKCPKEPIFTYTDFDCFVSQTFFVIKSDRINLKYLSGLLNSKLIAFWLRRKGKMQGNSYQLDKEPLLEIPIYKPIDNEANKIAALVDKVISQKQHGKDSSTNEKKIDDAIYKLYGLTKEEIEIVEGKSTE